MKKLLVTLTLATVLFFVVSAMAQTKVVVIPSGVTKMPTKAPAPVARTGQTPTLPFAAPAGSDGALQKGIAWPYPRFIDNNDGTVTDNLTGLIWLKKANCFGSRDWVTALSDSTGLANGACGLTDGSTAGDWRLPNRNELASLIDYAYSVPALSNAAGTAKWTEDNTFSDVRSNSYYWSSSASRYGTDLVWCINFGVGNFNGWQPKSFSHFVWPVRD